MKSVRNFVVIVLMGALLASLAGCNSLFGGTVSGSGTRKSESRTVSEFNEVLLSTVGTLTIEQTGTESLTVEGDDNIVPLITTVVQNSRLEIRHDPGNESFTTNQPLAYHLTVKDLRAIRVSASGDARSSGLQAQDLTVEVSGSGGVRLDNLQTQALTVNITGSGSATLGGTVSKQTVTIGGSGSYGGDALATTDTTITISGSGSATVRVSGTLNATVSGSGSVTYLGSPTVKQQVSGSGRVVQGTNQ
jgi:hypothetical protein